MAFTLNYSQSGFSQQEVTTVAEQLLLSQDDLRKVDFIQKPRDIGISSQRSMILIGIGGSSLGARAILEALRVDVRVTYLDMVDPRALQQALAAIEEDGREVVVVSKSGQTLETLINFGVLMPRLKHCTVVADEGTPLATFAQEQGYTFLESPKDIGGRFSLFTAVGLVPLARAGIDIEKFCSGAEKMRIACLGSDPISNPALYGAALLYLHIQNGRSLHSIFHTDTRLHGLAFWWRQILAESLGKDKKGITPLVNNPADLHAIFQRYAQGPQDVCTTFLSTAEESTLKLPDTFPLEPKLAGKEVDTLTDQIMHGVTLTYNTLQLPWLQVHLESLTEETMGAFCMWKMVETMYLAKLLGVNAFDQPAVEIYKSEVKKILGT